MPRLTAKIYLLLYTFLPRPWRRDLRRWWGSRCADCGRPIGRYGVYFVGPYWIRAKRLRRIGNVVEKTYRSRSYGHQTTCSPDCYNRLRQSRWFQRRLREIGQLEEQRDRLQHRQLSLVNAEGITT